MRLALAALTSLVLLGCGVQDVTVTGDSDELSTDAAPLLGVAGQDTADRACNLILRTATRTPKNGGYETKCGTTGCFVVWTGTLDVSTAALAEGVKPYVLYKNIDQKVWTKVAATKTTGAPAGFTRYAYRLDKNTLEDGMSFSSLQHARVEVSPYLLTKLGGRVFDHNRRPGDFDTYALSASTGWDLADDAQVCAPPADVLPTLTFENGWQNAQHGALVAGKKATVNFSIERLPACRGTHNGYPAWDTRAFLRFSPGGQMVDGSVRGFNNPGGTPSNSGAVSMPFTFDVPAGATGLDVWFVNADGAGMSCTTYDSNSGANYHFSVEPRFVDAVKWVGNPGSCQSRACSRSDGAPLVWKLDSYIQQRACLFNDLDVWAPGATDVGRSELLFAQVESALDGVAQPTTWLSGPPVKVGNDLRYRYLLPVAALYYGPKWERFTYTLRFSTDGRTWVKDVTRTLERDPSCANPNWP